MMRRWVGWGWALLLASVWLAVLPAQAQATSPELDDRGRAVAGVKPPQRIVSLLPSLTETVCALGGCDRLVGIDRHSNWPQGLQGKLPVVGGGMDPNIEAIVALRPDVVLLSNGSRLIQRLEALGLRTVVLEPHTLDDVHRVTQSVALLLGGDAPQRAAREWARIQAGLEQARQMVPAPMQHAKAYFEVSRGPYVAGPASFIGELMQVLGLNNVVPEHLGPFPRLNPEFLVKAQPDVIMLGSESMQAASSYAGWKSLRAVQHSRVCAFTPAESDIIVRPGPRLDAAARVMAACLARLEHQHGQ